MGYKDGLIQFINRYVRDLYQSEDLAQDVFVEVLLHPGRYRVGTSFKTYIYTIGHNTCARGNNSQILPYKIHLEKRK